MELRGYLNFGRLLFRIGLIDWGRSIHSKTTNPNSFDYKQISKLYYFKYSECFSKFQYSCWNSFDVLPLSISPIYPCLFSILIFPMYLVSSLPIIEIQSCSNFEGSWGCLSSQQYCRILLLDFFFGCGNLVWKTNRHYSVDYLFCFRKTINTYSFFDFFLSQVFLDQDFKNCLSFLVMIFRWIDCYISGFFQ